MSVPFIRTNGFQCVAHRGFSAAYPENTLIAFEQAQRAGATMVELDIRLTRDDEVVVFHDATLLRLAKKRQAISTLTWPQLAQVKLHDESARNIKDAHPVLLRDLFVRLGKKINYYVEIKYTRTRSMEYHHRLCERALDIVRQHKLENHVIFVSFEIKLLEWLRKADPKICLGWNFASMVSHFWYKERVAKIKAELCPYQKLCSQKRIQGWQEKGFLVLPWVVNKTPRMKELIAWGVNGITTDEIDQLVPLVPH